MVLHLANAIFYITDGEKTQDGVLVGSRMQSGMGFLMKI